MRRDGLSSDIIPPSTMLSDKEQARSVIEAWVTRLEVPTSRRTELVDITQKVAQVVQQSRVTNGMCHLYVPHSTAGITINENVDPAVARDIEAALDRMVPRDSSYTHQEGNTDSHVKSMLVGVAQSLPVVSGKLALGRWQGIFFCDFDGPRRREVRVRIVPDPA
jgi:secondary thiamine-phosphate synthase enzyme